MTENLEQPTAKPITEAFGGRRCRKTVAKRDKLQRSGRQGSEMRLADWKADMNVCLSTRMHGSVEGAEGVERVFSEPLFERLFLLAEIGNFTLDEMREYYNSLENMGDYDNIIPTAQEEAEKRGLAKGLIEMP